MPYLSVDIVLQFTYVSFLIIDSLPFSVGMPGCGASKTRLGQTPGDAGLRGVRDFRRDLGTDV